MKEPIKPEDIRKGDLLRWESSSTDVAHEWRAEGNDWPGRHGGGQVYLLDRPAPAVDLPTEPTLGWLTSKYGGSVLGTWERYESQVRSRAGEASALVRERDLPLDHITAFTPAVAVPKAALDELREWREALRKSNGIDALPTPAVRRIDTFLAAIDAANGDPR